MDKIKIQTFKSIKLAYIEHIGRYDEVPYDKYVPRLYAWAKENRVRPGFKNINVFHDDPEKINPSECKCWIGIPIKGNAISDDEVKIEEIPEMEVATMKFKGPNTEYKDAYRVIGEWMDEHGYDWNLPSYEVCSKKPKMVNGQMILSTTIHVPIMKK
jgi:DNA gyrase inhibitor GyrI